MSSWASFHKRYEKLTAELWKETSDSQRRKNQTSSASSCVTENGTTKTTCISESIASPKSMSSTSSSDSLSSTDEKRRKASLDRIQPVTAAPRRSIESVVTSNQDKSSRISVHPDPTSDGILEAGSSSFPKPFFPNVGRFSFGKSGIGVRSFQSFLSSITSYTTNASPGTPRVTRNRFTSSNSSLTSSTEQRRGSTTSTETVEVAPSPCPPTTSAGNPSDSDLETSHADTLEVLKTADSLNRIMNTQCLSPRPRPRHLNLNIQSNPTSNFQYGAFGSRSMGMGPQKRNPPSLAPLNFPSANASPSSSVSRPPNPYLPSSNQIPPPVIPRRTIHQGTSNSRPVQESVRISTQFPTRSLLTIDGKEYSITEDDFDRLEDLGSGSSGTVVKMRHKPTQRIIAVKQMRRTWDSEESKKILTDLEVLLKCSNCDHIVQCYGYMIKDAEVWICMELMSSCFDKLLKMVNAPFPEPILGKVAAATVQALHYLKENHSVIHRDIKPSNILVNERGVIKLCDFGICGRLVDSKAKTRAAGCTAYLSPERIDPDPRSPLYDVRADVWSLGITLIELALGKYPYVGGYDFEIMTQIIRNPSPKLPRDNFSQEFCDFTDKCLTKDVNRRPKYKGKGGLIEMPFIVKYKNEPVDVAKWFSDVMATATPLTPNNNH